MLMSAVVVTFEKFRQDLSIYYITFGIVLGQTIFPVWFFQGMERMKYITFLNILAKLIFTISIFLFVKESTDYFYVPLLNSLGFVIAGLLGLWVVFRDFGVVFMVPQMEDIKHQLEEGWYIFISTVAISLYTISNTFILGLFTNNTIVGYYSAVEKIVKSVQGLLGPISQTIYPYVSKLISESKEAGIRFLRKILFLIGVFSFILSTLIFTFSNSIVKIIFGSQFIESIIVLKILAFLPFIIGLSNIFGIQTMLNLNYKKAFSTILILASILNISLAIIMVPMFKHIGISISVMLSEIFVTVSMFLYLQNKGVKIIEAKII